MTYQGIFTTYSSNFSFCILFKLVRIKGCYNYPRFHTYSLLLVLLFFYVMWPCLSFRFFLATFRCLKIRRQTKFTSYGALSLMTIGVSGANPILSAWLANNSKPHCRRTLYVLAISIPTFFLLIFYHLEMGFWVPGVYQPGTIQYSAKQ